MKTKTVSVLSFYSSRDAGRQRRATGLAVTAGRCSCTTTTSIACIQIV